MKVINLIVEMSRSNTNNKSINGNNNNNNFHTHNTYNLSLDDLGDFSFNSDSDSENIESKATVIAPAPAPLNDVHLSKVEIKRANNVLNYNGNNAHQRGSSRALPCMHFSGINKILLREYYY